MVAVTVTVLPERAVTVVPALVLALASSFFPPSLLAEATISALTSSAWVEPVVAETAVAIAVVPTNGRAE